MCCICASISDVTCQSTLHGSPSVSPSMKTEICGWQLGLLPSVVLLLCSEYRLALGVSWDKAAADEA